MAGTSASTAGARWVGVWMYGVLWAMEGSICVHIVRLLTPSIHTPPPPKTEWVHGRTQRGLPL